MGGDLYLRERPAPRTGLAMSRLSAGLGGAFALGRSDPDPLCQDWWILREPELRLGGQILAPDLVGWRRERMERLPDTQYLTLAPDWVCQLLSTEQHRRELPDRRRLYAREGVRHLWLVHLAERALKAFELRDGGWVLISYSEGRQAGDHPPLRRDHLQPRRPVVVTRHPAARRGRLSALYRIRILDRVS